MTCLSDTMLGKDEREQPRAGGAIFKTSQSGCNSFHTRSFEGGDLTVVDEMSMSCCGYMTFSFVIVKSMGISFFFPSCMFLTFVVDCNANSSLGWESLLCKVDDEMEAIMVFLGAREGRYG